MIAQVEVIRSFSGLRSELLRSAYASYVAELVDRFLPERDRQDDVFALILDVLGALEHSGEDEVEVQTLWFALRLASDLGYRPEVEACVACGRALPQGAAGPVHAWGFNPALGGALCPDVRGRRCGGVPRRARCARDLRVSPADRRPGRPRVCACRRRRGATCRASSRRISSTIWTRS